MHCKGLILKLLQKTACVACTRGQEAGAGGTEASTAKPAGEVQKLSDSVATVAAVLKVRYMQ